jgi:hypothetical protein
MRDERRLNQRRLDELLEDGAGDLEVFVVVANLRAEIVSALATFGGRDVEPVGPGLFVDEVFVAGAFPSRQVNGLGNLAFGVLFCA